jgi:hypothetical protein
MMARSASVMVHMKSGRGISWSECSVKRGCVAARVGQKPDGGAEAPPYNCS